MLTSGTAGPLTSGTAGSAEVFGHYRLDVLLGGGATGVVFRAFDTRHDRMVALKRLDPHLAADEEYRARFRREAALAATLREPHIIPIHDYGEIDGRLFVDMRLVEGVDLARLLRRAPLSPVRAVDVVSQIADALDAAHAEDLVHRDVKPSNILLVGDVDRAARRGFGYLVDLCVAWPLDRSAATGPEISPPAGCYLAPESCLDGRCDRRADVFALACVLYECLVGRPAFPVGGVCDLRGGSPQPRPPRPSQLRPGLPPRLDGILARGMAEDPGQRYPSAGALAAAARAVLADHVADGPTVPVPVRPEPTRAVPGPPSAPGAAAVPRPVDGRAVPGHPPGRRVGEARSRRRRRVGIAGGVVLVAALAALAVLVPVLLRDTFVEVARVRVGLTPADVVLSPGGRLAYVANLGDDTVSVVDTATHTVVGEPIAVGDGPNTLALTGDGTRLYVSNTRSDSVTVVDTATRRAAATVAVGAFPDAIVLSPDGKRLYVGNAEADSVSVIDTATDAVVGRSIAVGRSPYGMGISPDGGTLYVSGFDSDEVTAVDTKANAVAWRTAVGDGPLNVAVDRDGARVYVVNTLDDTITIVDPATRSAAPGAITVGTRPIGIVLSPDARTLYVTERDADRVSAVSTASHSRGGSVEPGKGPVAMAVAGDRLYVVSEISGELTVLRAGPPG